MVWPELTNKAVEWQLKEDERALEDEDAKIGEGANTSAHVSSRGYVVKPVAYDWKSVSPFEQVEVVEKIDRFPWIEVDKRDSDGPFEYALVKIDRSDLSHEEAADTIHIDEIIEKDLDMFFDLRADGITYCDFKPDNIGYFWEDGDLLAKPIDVIDKYAWTEEENLLYRRFSDIMDVYIRGTPNEDGITDIYPVTVSEAEKHIMAYIGLEADITGDPYIDLFQALDDSQDNLGEVLNYNLE